MKMIWEWIVGVVRFFRRGSLWAALGGIVIFAACAGPEGSINSPHGYDVEMETGVFGFKIEGTPTILQPGETALHSEYKADGSAKDMPSTYVVRPDGTVKASGLAATWLARAAYCRIATCE